MPLAISTSAIRFPAFSITDANRTRQQALWYLEPLDQGILPLPRTSRLCPLDLGQILPSGPSFHLIVMVLQDTGKVDRYLDLRK